jgi:hypothetical protein
LQVTAVAALAGRLDMGLLDQVFGGTQAGSRGGASPVTLGLLGLLAYRTYEGKAASPRCSADNQVPRGRRTHHQPRVMLACREALRAAWVL